jgi:non-heme chloroperoxidase
MSTITTKDGTTIHFKDWGSGRPVVLSHGWPLNADSWESQAFHLSSNGFRVVTHDRRGHGRSSQPWDGNDMDHYADDLAQLIEHLALEDAMLVGFSTGGGEVARYVGRHGTRRVAKLALISAVPPLMVKTAANPDGSPTEVFDGLRTASIADRSKLYHELAAGPFFGFNRPGATPSQGMIDSFWLQGMMSGHKNAYDCIKAFSETDFTEDLKRFDKPTLVIHGDDDQIVPIGASAHVAAKLIPHATLVVYPGAPHGLADTHKHRLNADLLEFAKSSSRWNLRDLSAGASNCGHAARRGMPHSTMQRRTLMKPALPKPIADYVGANAQLDVDGMLKPFAADAVLSDNGRRHEGHAELRTLFEDEVIAVKAIFTPDAVRHEDGQVVVEGPAHGDFKGSPIRFTYRFTLENDAIKALEITL